MVLSPVLGIVYALVLTLIAVDLIMALDPHWVSTLFGAYYFIGSFYTALAALLLMTVIATRLEAFDKVIRPKHLHDLGKLLLGFCLLTGDFFYSQFLVIWYGNLPEETYFIFYRLWGAWRPVGVAVFLMVFLIPFIGLLGVRPKRSSAWLLGFALVSLAGVWLERYFEIVPSLNGGAGPVIGLPELGATAFFGGLYVLSYSWFAARYPMISPRLAADTLAREHGH